MVQFGNLGKMLMAEHKNRQKDNRERREGEREILEFTKDVTFHFCAETEEVKYQFRKQMLHFIIPLPSLAVTYDGHFGNDRRPETLLQSSSFHRVDK